MKKIFIIITLVIFVILGFFAIFKLAINNLNNVYEQFNSVKNEIITKIEGYELTDFELEKLNYIIYKYWNNDYDYVFTKTYSLKQFERYLKERDYELWYQIKGIFNE